MLRVISSAICVTVLGCLCGQTVRGDFVSYNLFGSPGGSPGNATRLGNSDRLVLTNQISLQNFDSGTEGSLASIGWTGTHFTDPVAGHNVLNMDDPLSDSYLGWTLISQTRLSSVFGARRLQVATGQELNGTPITELLNGNLLYAESDLRGGKQVQYLFSPSFDFTGQQGVVLAFSSAYEQNQDSTAGVEFSIDGGQSWKPVIYLLDRNDIVRFGDGSVDAIATLTRIDPDGAAFGTNYGAFIAAPLSQNLAPYISGRVNDDQVESKRLEVFRLPDADDQPRVVFRLFHAGTASWYWGIDNWGFYRVPYTDRIAGRLKNFGNGSDTAITMTLSVNGRPLAAQVTPAPALTAPPAGTDAGNTFTVSLDSAGLTTLPSNQVNTLDLSGLHPQKTYELVLYSDKGSGGGATGNRLNYTLSGADEFSNGSSSHPTLAVTSGSQNETVTIDVTDNSRFDRGFICKFTGIRSGADGAIRVTLQSAQKTCLNALKLVETTLQLVAPVGQPIVSENSATVNGVLNTGVNTGVYLYWGLSDGGTDSNQWQHVQFLGNLAPGAFSATLTELQTFKKYYFALAAGNPDSLAWSAAASFRPQFQGMLYGTGFEPGENVPFTVGSLQGQDGQGIWRVSQGSAFVQQARAAHGVQSVQAGQCTIDVNLTNSQQVLWVDAFFLEGGSTNQPLVPTNVVSSVIFFSASTGIMALDGNGTGGGTFVQVVPGFSTNDFVRVTIRNDYQAKRYDVWIDGVPRAAGLGFKSNTVQKLSGAQRRTIQSSYMDDFSISIWGLDQDSDGDGLVDLDEAKFYDSYPLLADSDDDGAWDGQEVLAGTNPGDEDSVFALKINVDAQQNRVIRVPTVTGRQYTLQRRGALGSGAWQDVPNATGVPGDGREKVFLETGDGQNYFYRGVIINR